VSTTGAMSEKPLPGYSIRLVTEADLAELLPLMRAYCDFYATAPSDQELLALSRALLAEPRLEGLQLLARDQRSAVVGFATVFWSWDTTEASRIGIMNDLFVAPAARGRGLADELIQACLQHCAQRGASRLEWQTAPQNMRAQAVYDRVGGVREPWLAYTMNVPGATPGSHA
jgi:GNAT superfamily N-acetyltransferase